MNFFASQDAARRKTRLLLVYYVLALAGMVCAFYLVSRGIAFLTLGGGRDATSSALHPLRAGFQILAWDARWLLATAGASLLIILGGTLWRRFSLSAGGVAVARSVGGREVDAATRVPEERRLLNVVEEIALAAGVPVPRVFVLDNEPGINAFAAGFSLHDAAVAVTRGTLQRLNRDELQGVIAHEFSHILNGDMRLNSWLLGILFGILVISILGRLLLQSLHVARFARGRRKGGGGGGVLMMVLAGVALWLIGSIGVLFARLIQASVARQREYLADASAVQFTRNPAGLAGALKRIGAASHGSRLQCANRAELAHLLFSSPVRRGLHTLLASHPPLVARIQRLDPHFDGDFTGWGEVRNARGGQDGLPKTQQGTTGSASDVPAAQGVREVLTAAAFLHRMQPELRHAVTSPEQAGALLYALLLADAPDVRARQRALLCRSESQGVADSAEALRTTLQGLDRTARRMALDLAITALRRRTPEARRACVQRVRDLADADGALSLFEWLLQHRVARSLLPRTAGQGGTPRALPPRQVASEAARVLGALAYAGAPADDAQARAAWQAGAQRATTFGVAAQTVPDRATCTLPALDTALQQLNGVIPLLKGELLNACAAVIRADGVLSDDEKELLRGVADALEMPLPLSSDDSVVQ